MENASIKKNYKSVFENAISKGLKNPGNWMYMCSGNGYDFFKHCMNGKSIKFKEIE